MHQRSAKIIAVLLTAILLLGCSGEGNKEQTGLSSPAPDETVVVEEPIAETVEVTVSVENTFTPVPEMQTESPETESPVPDTADPIDVTDTPEPNPYVGVWTIEDLPFSLELRDDKTYLITASQEEREGTYTFSDHEVTLYIDEESTVELHYYSRADTLKADEMKLIRDDLVFFFDIDGVPVSFRAENDDLTVMVRGAIVDVETKENKKIKSYCFTGAGLVPPDGSRDWFDATDSGKASNKIQAFKYDGNYTIWAKDVSGELLTPIDVSVASGFRYPIDTDGIDYLQQSFRSFLHDRGLTVDAFNRGISRDVTTAGIYTRAGVVSAGVSLISTLSKYGYAVGYQEKGSYEKAQDWGVNPYWGEYVGWIQDKEPVQFYAGMGSRACIVWAYRQAGLNLCTDSVTDIETIGEHERYHDNKVDPDRAETGDLIKLKKHYWMVIDRLDRDANGADDAYLTFGMNSPIMSVKILSFDQMDKYEVFSMDAFFNNDGRNYFKVKYWRDQFRIPMDELPIYLRETMESEEALQQYLNFLGRLGI